MKTSWPRVAVSVTRTFDAEHSLPFRPERHRHTYYLTCGYCHEINPDTGVTKSMEDMKRDMEPLVEIIEGKYLNDILSVPPTAEMIVCWFLANLPPYWDWVELTGYGAFHCKIERHNITNAWLEKLRASAA